MSTDLPNADEVKRRTRAPKPAQQPYQKKELTQEEIIEQANKLWTLCLKQVSDHFSLNTCPVIMDAPGISKKAFEYADENYYKPRGYKMERRWNPEDGQSARVSLL